MIKITQQFCGIRKVLWSLVLLLSLAGSAQSQSSMSLEEAAEFVRKTSQGKVLSAKTSRNGNEKIHRIQVLTPSGRVKIYQIPAKDSKNNYRPGDEFRERGESRGRDDRYSRDNRSSRDNSNYRDNSSQRNRQSQPKPYRPPTARPARENQNNEKKDK